MERLGQFADRTAYGPDPPETYREAHAYVFALQRRAQQRVMCGHDATDRDSAFRACRYHAALVPEAVRCDPEWAWYAWQAAADDAKQWPSVERVRVSRAAWAHYWCVIDGMDESLELAG